MPKTKKVAPKHPKLTWDRVQRMVNGYNDGMTIRQLSVEYGYSYSGMHHILKDNGVTFRARGGKVTQEAKKVN